MFADLFGWGKDDDRSVEVSGEGEGVGADQGRDSREVSEVGHDDGDSSAAADLAEQGVKGVVVVSAGVMEYAFKAPLRPRRALGDLRVQEGHFSAEALVAEVGREPEVPASAGRGWCCGQCWWWVSGQRRSGRIRRW